MFTLIAVFLLQFMMKFADKLVGKGLSAWVITQLIVYNLAWMVVLVGPMAVLVATLMAFGNMAQNNEIAIMKATGISLYRMMIPPLLASVLIAYSLVLFNNHVYPNANHAARILMQDITQKKPTLSLVSGVFSQDVRNYSILVRNVDPESNKLENITIYDRSTPGKMNVVTAEFGKIYFSKDSKKLIMDLEKGEIHESSITKRKSYRKIIFDKHKIAMPAEQFSFQQSGLSGRRGDRELGASEMLTRVDTLLTKRSDLELQLENKLSTYVFIDSLKNKQGRIIEYRSKEHLYLKVKEKIKTAKNIINSTLGRLSQNKKEINRYWVEIHKKYALPVACIVFILIGAPLGTMTRRGGFGMAAGISLLFFLVYWAFLIGGEKLSDRGLLSPFWGMWSANILLGLLGIYLTFKSAKERVTLDFSFPKRLLPNKWVKGSKND